MGQSAWLMSLGDGALLMDRNPFFGIMPPWFLLVGIGISTAAAIIASQALISGSYTLINEANNLKFWGSGSPCAGQAFGDQRTNLYP